MAGGSGGGGRGGGRRSEHCKWGERKVLENGANCASVGSGTASKWWHGPWLTLDDGGHEALLSDEFGLPLRQGAEHETSAVSDLAIQLIRLDHIEQERHELRHVRVEHWHGGLRELGQDFEHLAQQLLVAGTRLRAPLEGGQHRGDQVFEEHQLV